MRGVLKYFGAGLVLLASLQTSIAASLQNVEGSVLVNRGNGFEVVGSGTQVKPGDQVLVRSNGSATIVFNEACVTKLDAGSSTTVPAEVPCAPPVGGLAGAAAPAATTMVIGAAVVAGGVALAVGLGGNDSAKPASP